MVTYHSPNTWVGVCSQKKTKHTFLEASIFVCKPKLLRQFAPHSPLKLLKRSLKMEHDSVLRISADQQGDRLEVEEVVDPGHAKVEYLLTRSQIAEKQS